MFFFVPHSQTSPSVSYHLGPRERIPPQAEMRAGNYAKAME